MIWKDGWDLNGQGSLSKRNDKIKSGTRSIESLSSTTRTAQWNTEARCGAPENNSAVPGNLVGHPLWKGRGRPDDLCVFFQL